MNILSNNHSHENVPSRTITLKVVENDVIIFQSDKHWIHPLLDLDTFISQYNLDISNAEIYDKITGKAAAMLILRFGVRVIHTNVISRLACEIFDQNSLTYFYTTLVDRINCKTEALLHDIHDPEEAYLILVELSSQHKTGG